MASSDVSGGAPPSITPVRTTMLNGAQTGRKSGEQSAVLEADGGGGRVPDPDPGGWLRSPSPDSGEGDSGVWLMGSGRWRDGRAARGGGVYAREEEVGGWLDPDSNPRWRWPLFILACGGEIVRCLRSGGGLAAGTVGGDLGAMAVGGGGGARRWGGGWMLEKVEGRGGLGLGLWVVWALGFVAGLYDKEEEVWAWMESFRGDIGLIIKASRRGNTLARLGE